MRAPRLLIATVVAAGLFAACSSSSKSAAPTTTTSTSIVPAPTGIPAAQSAFYSYSEPIPKAPGTIIKSERVAAPNIKADVYRVLYVSTTVDNKPTPVSGVIYVPKTKAPATGYPVVSWGHGTNGMADMCTPSINPDSAVPLINMLLDKGWLVTASDYQGEGTPGLLPYIAGDSAARNTIDIVRAAHKLPNSHASNDYVVWGHSEGGHTAMFTLHIGTTYAPELTMKGVVAGAPPSQFDLIYSFLQTSPFKYYLLMAAGGLNAAYGDVKAPLDQILTPEGEALVPELDKGCSDYVAAKLKGIEIKDVTKADPFKVPLWKTVLQANDPQQFKVKSSVPLLMIQGANDEQIPPVSTKILATHLCNDLKQVLQRWVYPGQTHAGVIGPSATDMVKWIGDRFAGGANPDPYQPTGLPNIDVTTCA